MIARLLSVLLISILAQPISSSYAQGGVSQRSGGDCSPNISAGGDVTVYCSTGNDRFGSSSSGATQNSATGNWCKTSQGIVGPGASAPIGSSCTGDGAGGTVVSLRDAEMGSWCNTSQGTFGPGASAPVGTRCHVDGESGPVVSLHNAEMGNWCNTFPGHIRARCIRTCRYVVSRGW